MRAFASFIEHWRKNSGQGPTRESRAIGRIDEASRYQLLKNVILFVRVHGSAVRDASTRIEKGIEGLIAQVCIFELLRLLKQEVVGGLHLRRFLGDGNRCGIACSGLDLLGG
jgi:hypothetical protein